MVSVRGRTGIGPSLLDEAPSQSPPLVAQLLFGIFNVISCGAVLLDESKRVLHFNRKAKSYLGQGLAIANERLCASDRECDAILQTVLDQLLKCREGETRLRMQDAVGLRRFERPRLIARVVPVVGEARAELDGAALVIILVDPLDCPEPPPDMLEQVFGFTKSEARVASRLMCGESLQQVAETLGVAVGTVRAQMRSIFAKTHTHRQAELVGLLTRLAMISERQSPG